jgi:hypothetical protein
VDRDPAFHSSADPDPASPNYADPDPQPRIQLPGNPFSLSTGQCGVLLTATRDNDRELAELVQHSVYRGTSSKRSRNVSSYRYLVKEVLQF